MRKIKKRYSHAPFHLKWLLAKVGKAVRQCGERVTDIRSHDSFVLNRRFIARQDAPTCLQNRSLRIQCEAKYHKRCNVLFYLYPPISSVVCYSVYCGIETTLLNFFSEISWKKSFCWLWAHAMSKQKGFYFVLTWFLTLYCKIFFFSCFYICRIGITLAQP